MHSFLSALLALKVAHAAPVAGDHALEFVKRNGIDVPFWYPETTAKTFTVSPSLSEQTIEEAVKFGVQVLQKELGLNEEELSIQQSYRDEAGVTHIYAIRKINGISVDNHNANVHIKDGQVLAFSASFGNNDSFAPLNVATPTARVSLERAVKVASAQLGAPRDNFPASQVYVQLPSGKMVFAHQFQLRDDSKSKWYQVTVDAENGQVVQVVDYVQQASYKVLKLPKSNPTDGFEVVADPHNPTASPEGWHKTATRSFTDTQGNNVESKIRTLRSDGGAELKFDHAWSESQAPNTPANQQAAIINNFYLSNMVHDVTYLYGFTEKAGNFQTSNFGRGGREGDSVIVNNQASGTNNANFATPPDGQRPTMNMYIWDKTTPNRDGSLENSIPIHEYVHGVSNRMTGGSGQANCLGTTESRGMGEGWSDTVAVYLMRKAGETREATAAMGDYAMNRPSGVRQYVYSTNTTTNPLMYNNIQGQNSVHAIGTIWATMLYEMYWNYVEKHGFDANYYDAKQVKGNIMAMQVVIGGLALQPCNPTFMTARDAIIAADQSYYGGQNKCLIWKAFAKRGLGTDAVQRGYKNGFAVPADCQ
jgi:extracellular elastinolytic metalloproteinase